MKVRGFLSQKTSQCMQAIDLFPYWDDNRALLAELVQPLREEELEFRPAPGFDPLGEVLRHIITTEESWWHGGIHGVPFDQWRPAEWDRRTGEEKAAYRRQRFPTVASILDGLRVAHAPVVQFLKELDAWALCERRRSTWGEENSLRWMLWHLVEHDQHHRGQVYTRLRMLGYQPPSTFPRAAVMGGTPAAHWRLGEVEIKDIVPFWKAVRSTVHDAVASLTAADLPFRPADGFPSIHDLVLHLFIWEDFLIRQMLKGEVNQDWGRIEGSFWKCQVTDLALTIGDRFPSVVSLLEAMDAVHDATRVFIEGLEIGDLTRPHETPWGPQTLHHTLWYAREHAVHHRAQLFLRMRMVGRMPPEI